MPIGVAISTATRTGPANPPGPSSGRLIIGGVTTSGPTDEAVKLTSITDYVNVYGTRDNIGANVFDCAESFFQEGGSEAWVCRATGPGATSATLTLKDQAATPANTLRIDGSSAGVWGQTVSVQIDAGSLPNTSTLSVVRGGVVVERYSDQPSPSAIAAAAANSAWINVTDLGSLTVAPGNLPAVLPVTPLVGGNDDRTNVTAATVIAALNTLAPAAVGPGAVCAPGYSATQVGAGLIAHAVATERIALLAAPQTADQTAAIALANSAWANGDSGGLFWPWLIAPEGSATKLIPPEGYVAGVRARAQSATGIWQVPAGARADANFITGTATTVDNTLNNTLDAGRVNGITTSGRNVRLYNWRSLSTNTDQYLLLSSRDFLNSISALITTVLDADVWATIDGTGLLQASIEGSIVGVLQPIADAGGLYALTTPPNTDGSTTLIDPGYTVDVTATPTQLGQNQLVANVGVRLSPFAALIQVAITKSNLTASV